MRLVALGAGLIALLAGGGSEGSASAGARAASVLFIHGFPTGTLKVVKADGKRPAKALARHAVGPKWSPSGDAIVYYRAGIDSGEIHVMQADGRKNHVLTRGGVQPAWSPDGKRIAYAGLNVAPLGIAVVGRSGGVFRRLTHGFDDSPAWSPDGREIAFHHVIPDIADEIWVVNIDGTGLRRLAGDLGDNALEPVWSPDGETIAFIRLIRSVDGLFTPKIHVVNRDGSGQRSLTGNTTPGVDEVEPAWSPDGRKIVFIHETRALGAEIHVVNSDGSAERTLAKRVAGGWGSGPAWSPDGRKIAFAGVRDGDGELYVMNADGSRKLRLTRSRGADRAPAWRPVP